MPAWYAWAVPLLSTASGSPADDSRTPVTAGHTHTAVKVANWVQHEAQTCVSMEACHGLPSHAAAQSLT